MDTIIKYILNHKLFILSYIIGVYIPYLIIHEEGADISIGLVVGVLVCSLPFSILTLFILNPIFEMINKFILRYSKKGVIIALYLIIFAIMSVFVPCNVYYDGKIYGSSQTGYVNSKINYGLQYMPVFNTGYKDIHTYTRVSGYDDCRRLDGVQVAKINLTILALELILLTVFTLGIWYILCNERKREIKKE